MESFKSLLKFWKTEWQIARDEKEQAKKRVALENYFRSPAGQGYLDSQLDD